MVATSRLSPTSSRRQPPPLSSRSAGITGGVSGFLQTKQRLVHLTTEEAGKCCLGLVGSATGPKTRVCVAPKMFGSETCGVSSHVKKGFVAVDAYYVPAKSKSILQWPFVTRKHVKLARATQLATVFAPTEVHLESIHSLYDAHPQFLTELVLEPPIRSLLNAPDPVGTRASGSRSSSFGSRGSKVSHTSAAASGTNLHLSMEASTASGDVKSLVIPQVIPSASDADSSDEDRSHSSDSGSIRSDVRVARAFVEFGPVKAHLPDTEYTEDVDSAGEPWVRSDIALRQAVSILAAKLEHLANITWSGFQQRAASMAELRSRVDSLRSSLNALFSDVNGTWDREDTYDEFGSLWDGIMHVSAVIGDLTVQCSSAQDTAQHALEQAAASDVDLSTEMAEVADGFQAIVSRLESLELNPAPAPAASARPTSLFQQFSARPPPPDVDGGVDSSFATQLASLQFSLTAQQELLEAQQLELAQQREHIATLRAEAAVVSQQDQMNRYSLMDEAGLTALLEDEGFDPSRVAIFCDMNSLLSHATEAFKGITELGERTKLMIQCGIADQSCQKTIFSFERQYPPGFETNEGGTVRDGDTFPIFKSKKVWVGSDGRSGARAKYLSKVDTASERAIAYVMRYTKAGPLRELCLEMIRTSQRFWTGLFDYLNNDLERLIQFGISEKECLVLVSEQLQIVFEQVFIKRMMMPEFSVIPGTKVSFDYAAQIFFFTLQAHTAMVDFTDKKFTGHGLLGNTFIRFLARQCGNSSSAALETRLSAVEKKVNNKWIGQALLITP